MAGSVLEIRSEQEFREKVLNNSKPAMVDFWAVWCAPCRAIAPLVEAIAEAYADQLVVAKVNVDDLRDLAVNYGINSIPTLLFFKKGQLVDRIVGVPRPGNLEKKLEKLLSA